MNLSGGLWLKAPEAEEHVVLGGRMMNLARMTFALYPANYTAPPQIETMASFFDTPIPNDQIFANAPNCRTRREATQHYLHSTHFSEPQPPTDSAVKILHQITHPFSMGKLIDRQVILQDDGCTIRKSVRIGRSSLSAEKRYLELVKAKTSVPVPSVRHYYLSKEFEHLIMDNMPGMTLERAWPTLSPLERESIADEVASLVEQLRKLHSPCIEAALLQRQPFRTGFRGVTAFNMERIKKFLSNEHIVAYVHERSEAVDGELNVFTHGDLDWGNILIANKRVCGIIDLESSGFFPPYWEWVTLKSLSQGLPDGSWFCLLEQRLRKEDCLGWKGMWEVEQLIMALDLFSQWALTPAGRDENRNTGWAEVIRILGPGVGEPPLVAYAMATEHPWWLESYMEVTRKADGNKASHLPLRDDAIDARKSERN
ncbi:Protein kinase-like domain [Fusarium austroafricanum]|uniref:Protein kinase-like domain n=1 Tax=Fusarium austroafricanum TaxID=2364996 RepID=A0A8H4KM87_9HYPO|nr:Protein kinase-like domain [Fusarium austroafricanum]